MKKKNERNILFCQDGKVDSLRSRQIFKYISNSLPFSKIYNDQPNDSKNQRQNTVYRKKRGKKTRQKIPQPVSATTRNALILSVIFSFFGIIVASKKNKNTWKNEICCSSIQCIHNIMLPKNCQLFILKLHMSRV